MKTHGYAMPEWLNRADSESTSWVVTAGAPKRGEAFTNLITHKMQVPLGNDETSRCIRAHEMMHAKVSPINMWVPEEFGYLDNPTLEAAEEFRINMLLGAAQFPVMKFLADGSERRLGEILAHNNDWNQTVCLLAGTAGTKSISGYLAGVRSTRPLWNPLLSELHQQLKLLWRSWTKFGLERVASTEPWLESTTGWRFTIEVAKLLHHAMVFATERDLLEKDPNDSEAQGLAMNIGFGTLLELPVHRSGRVDGRIGRRKRPTNIGKYPRHLDRLLTDPDRRIFDRRLRGKGGVVLIDQSGSMQLTENDLWKIIDAAPGCVIIGYSHFRGRTDMPNIWVLAERGCVVETVPKGNGGNGVDGPAIRFALKKRLHNETMIWVCDGHVTDQDDNQQKNLTEECARLVIAHKIHQVPNVQAAIRALTQASLGVCLKAQAVGPIFETDAWQNSGR